MGRVTCKCGNVLVAGDEQPDVELVICEKCKPVYRRPFRVCHIPQVGVDVAFVAECDTILEASQVSDAIANYDLFLAKQGLRGDFSNASFIEERGGENPEEWYALDSTQVEEMVKDYREERK